MGLSPTKSQALPLVHIDQPQPATDSPTSSASPPSLRALATPSHSWHSTRSRSCSACSAPKSSASWASHATSSAESWRLASSSSRSRGLRSSRRAGGCR